MPESGLPSPTRSRGSCPARAGRDTAWRRRPARAGAGGIEEAHSSHQLVVRKMAVAEHHHVGRRAPQLGGDLLARLVWPVEDVGEEEAYAAQLDAGGLARVAAA